MDKRSQMSWFQPRSLEPLYKFELLGVLTSLAVYNGLPLPFNFPLVFYQKLLGSPITLSSLRDGWPERFDSLRKMVTWEEGDVANWTKAYEFFVETPGSRWTVTAGKNGE